MRPMRPRTILVLALAGPIACWKPDPPRRAIALAASIGRQCAKELDALAQISPESAVRALDLDPRAGAASDESRARLRVAIARDVAALVETQASPEALAVARARSVAERLCRARDTTYVLARLPRPPHVLPSDGPAGDSPDSHAAVASDGHAAHDR